MRPEAVQVKNPGSLGDARVPIAEQIRVIVGIGFNPR